MRSHFGLVVVAVEDPLFWWAYDRAALARHRRRPAGAGGPRTETDAVSTRRSAIDRQRTLEYTTQPYGGTTTCRPNRVKFTETHQEHSHEH